MSHKAIGQDVRVVVADDHPLFRDGVVRALSASESVQVVAEAGDGTTALVHIKNHRPDVALLDYFMPGMNGQELAAALKRDGSPTRLLLISAHNDAALVYEALQHGATGFLPKESTRAEIVDAVLACARGSDVVSPVLIPGLAEEIRRRAEPVAPVLTTREREVLNRIALGHSAPTIAAELHVAASTVKTHLQRLYEILGVNNRGAAVAEAMRRHLLD